MKILIIEDNKALCDNINLYLSNEGYTVNTAYDGNEALLYIKEQIYDLILLDCMLPGVSGLSILKQLRQLNKHTYVILVTALGSIEDRVTGLDLGADDYLVKPFAMEELLARIRALIRRPSKWDDTHTIILGNTTLDLTNNSLISSNKHCSLSKREGQLLEYFFKHPNSTLQRATLLAHVWNTEASIEDGNLDNYIYFLRRRLNVIHSDLQLKTVRGIGFILEVPTC